MCTLTGILIGVALTIIALVIYGVSTMDKDMEGY